MKIVLLHNYYRQSGGEDVVVRSEKELLISRGHHVVLVAAHNHAIKSIWDKIETFYHAPYSRDRSRCLERFFSIYKPDLVHVHNFFPLLTPSVYDACRAAGIPVVQTLHNYRMICPNALLLRSGKICEDCVTASAYHAVLHGCYRNSRVGSLMLARMIEFHRKMQTWQRKVDRFIVLTEFARKKFIEGGFPRSKLVVKPNFYQLPVSGPTVRFRTESSGGGLFVGRLSREKGLLCLARAWEDLTLPIRIIGTGPMFKELKSDFSGSFEFLGQLDHKRICYEMARADFLIFPSETYEAFGLVLIEAMAHGLPVIASRLGSMLEIVEDGVTGLHFTGGDPQDLAAKVKWLWSHGEERERMGQEAFRVYQERYTPDRNYKMLMAIYEEAIKEHEIATT